MSLWDRLSASVGEYTNILWAAFAGVLITLATTEGHSWKMAFSRTLSGLLVSVIFTSPVLDYMQWDADIYERSVAALLAMMGFQLGKTIVSMDLDKLITTIKTIRGGGK